jgi:hypothetical protein
MGAAGARTLAMLATVTPAAFVASGQPQNHTPAIARAHDAGWQRPMSAGWRVLLRLAPGLSAGGQNQRAIGGNSYGVLGMCAS